MRLPRWVLYGSAFGTFLGGGALLRERVFGEAEPEDAVLQRAKGKIVIVTGANSGIGREISESLAKHGARVIMACRDMKKCEKVRKEIIGETLNRHVVCRACDLGSYSSIKAFVARVKEEEPKIDVLVNNAGVMGCPKSVTSEGLETHFGVNFMGSFVLTALLLDKLKGNPGNVRIVNVSDSAFKRGEILFKDLNRFEAYDPKEAYNQSKLAVVLFTALLKQRLSGNFCLLSQFGKRITFFMEVGVFGTNVEVVAAEAGGLVNTPLLRHFGIYNSILAAAFVWPLAYPFLRTARHGAATPLYAALCPSKDISVPYLKAKEADPGSIEVLNVEDAKRLWAIAEHWSGIKFPS
ncbi:unnamed protein product [Notodromas monacha]|uniref:Retinol dehydrogenase 13 n=1 Tax=Notodromas monacha TaxID=399045 RepID=A0A7R9GA79_9CRUS|nr:unnamed protein product [Notodromas monacha]CAG0913415.1 unnamed protein product [Notodromas monacha]